MALHKSGSGQQTSEHDIWVGPIFIRYSHLILCEASKSSAGLTLLTCPPVPTFFPFSTIDRVYIEFVLRSLYFPIRPRDQLDSQSLLLFAPIISSFDQVLDSGNKSPLTPPPLFPV